MEGFTLWCLNIACQFIICAVIMASTLSILGLILRVSSFIMRAIFKPLIK